METRAENSISERNATILHKEQNYTRRKNKETALILLNKKEYVAKTLEFSRYWLHSPGCRFVVFFYAKSKFENHRTINRLIFFYI